MKDRLQVAGDLDVVSLVIDTWKGNRSKIAALATTVCEAARTRRRGMSARILSAAADELVTLIETTRTLVGFTDDETVPVSYSGGMFSDDGFRALFVAALQRAARQVRPADVRVLDPAVGAALYAAKHSGHPLSPDAVQQLSDEQTRRGEVIMTDTPTTATARPAAGSSTPRCSSCSGASGARSPPCPRRSTAIPTR